jgi:hypothetical protein
MSKRRVLSASAIRIRIPSGLLHGLCRGHHKTDLESQLNDLKEAYLGKTTGVTCRLCGDEIHPMLGQHEPPDDAYVALRGQWMWVPELDAAVFVLDPDSDMTVVTLPNGQLGLVTDEGSNPTMHLHQVCQEIMIAEETDSSWDEDDLLHRREPWLTDS